MLSAATAILLAKPLGADCQAVSGSGHGTHERLIYERALRAAVGMFRRWEVEPVGRASGPRVPCRRRARASGCEARTNALPWTDGVAFARRTIEIALSDREAVGEQLGWVFFDRGVI